MFTPPLRELTDQTSLGYAAVRFAEGVCGYDLYPWQKWLLIHSLELAPDLTVDAIDTRGRLDPIFRFRKVIVLVARQNGKSQLSIVLSLFFLYVLRTNLVLGTAQDLDMAEEVWDGALDVIDETPELAELADKPIRVNGKKTIRLLSGERYKVKAANRRAGRGLSGDLILLDELREHQSWDAWAAITKTTMARPAAMIWGLSNAGDASSIVLRYLRKMAHLALGDPDGINSNDDPSMSLPSEKEVGHLADLSEEDGPDIELDDLQEDPSTLGIFEWSAPASCAISDRDGWAAANPSMGYGISERTLAGDANPDGGEPEWVFRTECLCQWSDGSLEGPFPDGTWDEGTVRVQPVPQIVGKVAVCVDVSLDRTMAYIAFAGRNDRGRMQVEVVASRAGTEWVYPWLSERRDLFDAVTGQTRGAPVSGLMQELAEAGLPVAEWVGPDLPAWAGAFYDGIRTNTIDHLPQPVLDVAAATAVTKPSGDGWLWDRRKSPTDIAPLVAASGAVGLASRPPEKPTRSKYEDADLVVV